MTGDDLADLKDLSGSRFERLLFDLIVSEARAVGIPVEDVEWDHRVNVGDGGKDIVIRKPHQTQSQLIPKQATWFSAKSGDDGVRTAKFRKELKTHDAVVTHLVSGGAFVWCALRTADEDKKKEFREVAESLGNELGFDPSRVHFCWNEHLKTHLQAHFNVAIRYIERIGNLFLSVDRFEDWKEKDARGGKWVEFEARTGIVRKMKVHLESGSGPNWMHICGLSGVGKTRTVREAVETSKAPQNVGYCSDATKFFTGCLPYFKSQDVWGCLVVDEVPPERLTEMAEAAERHPKLRLISIGNLPRQNRKVAESRITVMEELSSTDKAVAQVIKSRHPVLPDHVCDEIERFSAHDLRLALMLAEAQVASGDFKLVEPITLTNAWGRIVRLFGDQLGDPSKFKECFQHLSAFTDVGITESHRKELESVAKYNNVDIRDYDKHIGIADRCGLGNKLNLFFESIPRVLAVHAFEQWEFYRIRQDLAALFASIPERLARKFLERCQECTGKVREEVMPLLGKYFLTRFGEPDLLRLAELRAAKTFRAWTEMDPAAGLRWLKAAVIAATGEKLEYFGAAGAIRAPEDGRREVVFLCEDLSAFPEYFRDCEEILWRLAQVETEKGIGNNSRGVWKEFFKPLLSGTATPFDERFEILLTRLRVASGELQKLALEAVYSCLDTWVTGRGLPRAVGGRLVPQQWQPSSRTQHYEQVFGGLRRFLSWVESLPSGKRVDPIMTVIAHAGELLRLGLQTEVGRIVRLAFSDAELRDKVVEEITRSVRFHAEFSKARREEESDASKIMKGWLSEVAPSSPQQKLHHYLTTFETEPFVANPEGPQHLEDLAVMVLEDPSVLDSVAELPEGRSADRLSTLAAKIAEKDDREILWPVVEAWLRAGSHRGFAQGYLFGRRQRRQGDVPEVQKVLDDLVSTHPIDALLSTLNGDVSAKGCDRVLRLLPLIGERGEGLVDQLFKEVWWGTVDGAKSCALLASLETVWMASEGEWAWRTAVRAAARLERRPGVPDWDQFGLSRLLTAVLEHPAKIEERMLAFHWLQVFQLFAQRKPAEALRLGFEVLTRQDSVPYDVREALFDEVTSLARLNPNLVPTIIEKALADQDRQTRLDTFSMWDLLEHVPFEDLKRWLKGAKQDAVLLVARHAPKPSVNDEGEQVLPAVTEWLLTAYEEDERVFRAFCMGTHVFSWNGGPDENLARARRNIAPFEKHAIRRVREWAKDAMQRETWFADMSRRSEEERERG
ncbi:MAG: hypothetical protein IT452_09875 [Planctomycetia bacterium]|nr:hypothetical protein [Planctomycetia bacterium]